VNTLLEHPDFEQLNDWMDSGTKQLSFHWEERREKQADFGLSRKDFLWNRHVAFEAKNRNSRSSKDPIVQKDR